MAPATTAPGKISASEIMDRLNILLIAAKTARLQLNPAPMHVYKPLKAGEGAALKLDLRLSPTFGDGDYVEDIDGGLFLELVAQVGMDDKGNAKFGWKDDAKRISAKLGLPDITSMLLAIRTVRVQGKKLPSTLKAPKGPDGNPSTDGTSFTMFHKFDTSTTVINVSFAGNGTVIEVRKSADNKRSIKLSLQEELELQSYLEQALTAFHLVGKR